MAPTNDRPDGGLKPDATHSEMASESFFSRLMLQFTTAWLFFTRIPLPGWWNRGAPDAPDAEAPDVSDTAQSGADEDGETFDKGATMIPLADTVRAWPIVGLLVGALAGLVLWAAANMGLSPLAASFVALIVAALATGAMHEDGLADVADGFGGGADKAKKLRIMRDSRIGAYGVLTLLLVVGFKAASLGSFNSPALAAGALLAAHTLSRAVLPLMMVALPPARRTGLGHGAGQPRRENAAMAAAIGVLVAVLTLDFGPGLVAAALAGLSAAAVGWLAKRQIGGFTGDVLGAAQQVVEALVIAGLAVVMRRVFYG